LRVSVRASASTVAVTPSGNGAEVFPWPEREVVDDRHAERLEVVLEHVLHRAAAEPRLGLSDGRTCASPR
jgi:hypothetical protein